MRRTAATTETTMKRQDWAGVIPAITTPEDANRLHVFVAAVTKLQRYAHNWTRGGHADSAHDLQVYAAMLEEFTDGK